MRILTVQQPWAWAIFHGKGVENRGLMWKYRGPLAIHAGARISHRGLVSPLVREAWAGPTKLAQNPDGFPRWIDVPSRDALPLGAILGVVDLVDSHLAADGCCDSPWGERSNHHLDRLVHLVLENPREFAEPITDVKGQLGLRILHDDRPEDRDLRARIEAAAT